MKLKTTLASIWTTIKNKCHSIWTAIKSRCHAIWTAIKNKCHIKTCGAKVRVSAPDSKTGRNKSKMKPTHIAKQTDPLPTEWLPPRYIPKNERVCPPRTPVREGPQNYFISIHYSIRRQTPSDGLGQKDYISITEKLYGTYEQAFDYVVKRVFDLYNAESTCEPRVNDMLQTISICFGLEGKESVNSTIERTDLCMRLLDAGYYVPEKFMSRNIA